ncbi:histidine kinase [Actinoplanes sp. NPDC089786]|uniref:sensor histidine kinase n=1 Tax=Actinoplanes sp. NPDC089786 TaxID=3155185 RepID=UPI0034331E2F
MDQPLLFAAGFCLAYLWTAVVAHLVLTWPTGRITRRVQTVLVVVCYLAATGTQVVRYAVDRPVAPLRFGVADPRTAASDAASVTFILCAVVVIAVTIRYWVTASRARRRPAAPVWAAVLVAAGFGVAVSVARLGSPASAPEVPLQIASLTVGLLLVPAVYAARILLSWTTRWRLATVVFGLDRNLADLETRLARTVRDPGLRLYYRLADGGHVDASGNRVPTPRPTTTLAITEVQRDGEAFALISHDPAVGDDPGLSRAAGAVAGVAIENAGLYSALQQHIAELGASRQRLATAAFAERRRIQRDLHDGAQQRLFAVLVLLDMAVGDIGDTPARATLVRAQPGLRDAIRSLRELTEGIYPVVLVEHGLGDAVHNLTDISPIPVTVAVAPGRWPQHVEITAYFVVAEALANVYKHAGAAETAVEISATRDNLVVTVCDNGCGPSGEGWRGLTDRVAAAGGFLTVDRASGSGTRVRATIPIPADPVHAEKE